MPSILGHSLPWTCLGRLRTLAALISRQPSKAKRTISTTRQKWGIDPHGYTSGRWLRRDSLETASRYISFDFDALCQRVIGSCPGATSITACQKVEGGFNRVFILTLDNAKKIVAKLPFKLAGPAKLSTLAEVATVRYLQLETDILIPKILDYNHDAHDDHNLVHSEYIIMEHASGVSLSEKWDSLPHNQHIRCIHAIYQTPKDLDELEFPAFGSIYFEDALEHPVKQTLGDGLCIGPHCGSAYWDFDPGDKRYHHKVDRNTGPWLNLDDYTNALIDVGISRVPEVDPDSERRTIYHGTPDAHLAILRNTRLVLAQMAHDPQIKETATPLLFHPDLHKRNIFVSEEDPPVVTAIID